MKRKREQGIIQESPLAVTSASGDQVQGSREESQGRNRIRVLTDLETETETETETGNETKTKTQTKTQTETQTQTNVRVPKHFGTMGSVNRVNHGMVETVVRIMKELDVHAEMSWTNEGIRYKRVDGQSNTTTAGTSTADTSAATTNAPRPSSPRPSSPKQGKKQGKKQKSKTTGTETKTGGENRNGSFTWRELPFHKWDVKQLDSKGHMRVVEMQSRKETTFVFAPPEEVKVVGSYASKTMLDHHSDLHLHGSDSRSTQGGSDTVDIQLQLPSSFLEPKDYLNYRYFDKRTAYLAAVGDILKKKDVFGSGNDCLKVETVELIASRASEALKPILRVGFQQLMNRTLGNDIAPTHDTSNTRVTLPFIHFVTTFKNESLPLARLSPIKRNVRRRAPMTAGPQSDVPQDTNTESSPTPIYNTLILEDMHGIFTYDAHVSVIQEAAKRCASVPEAIVLLRRWIRSRGMQVDFSRMDAFGEFHATMLLVHFALIGAIQPKSTPKQIFSTFLRLCVSLDLTTGPVVQIGKDPTTSPAHSTGQPLDTGFEGSNFRSRFDVVLLSPCGKLNLAARVSRFTFSTFRTQAAAAFHTIKSSESLTVDGHEAVLSPVPQWQRFDQYFRIDCGPIQNVHLVAWEEWQQRLAGLESSQVLSTTLVSATDDSHPEPGFDETWASYLLRKARYIVQRSLADSGRVKSFDVRVRGLNPLLCSLGSKGWSRPNSYRRINATNIQTMANHNVHNSRHLVLLVGVELNPAKAFGLIDRGPPAEDQVAAAKFREFWGPKSELRRFKDGSIVETTVWQVDETTGGNIETRRHIPEKILRYIFGRTEPFASTVHETRMIGRSLDFILQHSVGKLYAVDGVGNSSSSSSVTTSTSTFTSNSNSNSNSNSISSASASASATASESVDEGVSDEVAYRQAMHAFEDLSSRIRQVGPPQCPLSIISVESSHSSLRYAATIPPSPHPLAFGEGDQAKLSLLRSMWHDERTNSKPTAQIKKNRSQRSLASTASSWSRKVPVIDVIITAESSLAWPDDYEAIRHTKMALYARIADVLESQGKGYIRCIPFADGLDALLHGFAFRVVVRNLKEIGLLTREIRPGKAASVASEKLAEDEHLGIGKQIRSAGQRRQNAEFALGQKLIIDQVRRPLLHSQLQALHARAGRGGGAHTMSNVVRLAKLWVSGHGYWSHLSEEAIELIVASLYTDALVSSSASSIAPATTSSGQSDGDNMANFAGKHRLTGLTPPYSPLSGMARFLHTLAHWDWEFTPLLIDPVGDRIGPLDAQSATSYLYRQRKKKSGPAMCVLTPEDSPWWSPYAFEDAKTSENIPAEQLEQDWNPTWTPLGKPRRQVSWNLVATAKKSLLLLNHLCELETEGKMNPQNALPMWNALFASDVRSQADAWITLKSDRQVLAMSLGNEGNEDGVEDTSKSSDLLLYRNLIADADTEAIVGFDPLSEYMNILREKFGNLADFYVNPLQGKYIAVKFKPGFSDAASFRVAVAPFSKPDDRSSSTTPKGVRKYEKVVMNQTDVLESMLAVGVGFAVSVNKAEVEST